MRVVTAQANMAVFALLDKAAIVVILPIHLLVRLRGRTEADQAWLYTGVYGGRVNGKLGHASVV